MLEVMYERVVPWRWPRVDKLDSKRQRAVRYQGVGKRERKFSQREVNLTNLLFQETCSQTVVSVLTAKLSVVLPEGFGFYLTHPV